MGKYREIREQLPFTKCRRKRISCRSFDEAFESISWALSRAPGEVGVKTGIDGIWAVITMSAGTIPALTVFYTFDDDYVDLWGMICQEVNAGHQSAAGQT